MQEHTMLLPSFGQEYDDFDEITNPGIPALCASEYSRLLSKIPASHIQERAFYIWRMSGNPDQVKNWYDAEHQLINEMKCRELEALEVAIVDEDD